MRLVAIILSLFLIGGSFLPRLSSGALSTVEYISEGMFFLLFGILILVLSIYNYMKGQQQFGKVIAVSGISSLLIAVYYTVQVYFRHSSVNPPIPDIQLILFLTLILLASTGLVIVGVSQSRDTDSINIDQSRVSVFVANRIAFNPQKTFSRFIIRLSIVATVISVAVMIITLAFANGFQETVSQKVFSFWGHIRIQEKQPLKVLIAEEIPLIKNDSLVNAIKKNPEVESIHPFATKYAILRNKDDIEHVLLKGLDPTYDFEHLRPFIGEGRPIQFVDSGYSHEIMLSAHTAAQIQIKVNDPVLVYFMRPDESAGENNIRVRKLNVAGIFKTGISEYDQLFGICDIKLIQLLNDRDRDEPGEEDEVGGYEIFLKDYKKIDEVANEIYKIENFPPTWDTQSVKNISPNIFDWLNMQDVTRNVLIGIMILVAVINLITCLIILVLERVRMIGILKSLGATDWTVQKIFLRHSAVITITGIVVGALTAIGFLYLQKETGFIKLKEEAYYLSEAAVKIVWWQVAAICAGTLLVCFLVLMIPSVLVRKIQPVKAIHFR